MLKKLTTNAGLSVLDAIVQFGVGLAGIACGGDPSPSSRGR
jgi:hypothetical protein